MERNGTSVAAGAPPVTATLTMFGPLYDMSGEVTVQAAFGNSTDAVTCVSMPLPFGRQIVWGGGVTAIDAVRRRSKRRDGYWAVLSPI